MIYLANFFVVCGGDLPFDTNCFTYFSNLAIVEICEPPAIKRYSPLSPLHPKSLIKFLYQI